MRMPNPELEMKETQQEISYRFLTSLYCWPSLVLIYFIQVDWSILIHTMHTTKISTVEVDRIVNANAKTWHCVSQWVW